MLLLLLVYRLCQKKCTDPCLRFSAASDTIEKLILMFQKRVDALITIVAKRRKKEHKDKSNKGNNPKGMFPQYNSHYGNKGNKGSTRASACVNPKNSGLLEAFSEIVGHMKDKGEPGYKLGHYYKAINWIQNYEQEIENPMQYSEGETKVEGIVKGTATKMKQFMDTGTITRLEELRVEAGVPPGGHCSSSSSSSSGSNQVLQVLDVLMAASGQPRRSFFSIRPTVCICDKGHSMKVDLKPTNNCDLCLNDRQIKTRGTTYRCAIGCDYDVCTQCWLKERDVRVVDGSIAWPPKCQKGHTMVVSDNKEGAYLSGYVCDQCKGKSYQGHLKGDMHRWWCQACTQDYCFACVPKNKVEITCNNDNKKKVTQVSLLDALVAMKKGTEYILSSSLLWKKRERNKVLQQQQQSLSFVPPLLRTLSEVDRQEMQDMTIFQLYEKRMKRHRKWLSSVVLLFLLFFWKLLWYLVLWWYPVPIFGHLFPNVNPCSFSASSTGFAYIDILNATAKPNSPAYKYKNEIDKELSAGSTTSELRDTALLNELTGVLMEPPMSFNSCTLIRVDENNPSVLRFLVCAGNSGAGSPYDGGCFQFDLFCPTTYPGGPPKCWLMTTGSGTVRFNPNLYDTGYVCLTVLNAKGSGGQTWRKNESNVLEVILAIEYFCLNAMYPLFNEPSEEAAFQGMETSSSTKKRARTGKRENWWLGWHLFAP